MKQLFYTSDDSQAKCQMNELHSGYSTVVNKSKSGQVIVQKYTKYLLHNLTQQHVCRIQPKVIYCFMCKFIGLSR